MRMKEVKLKYPPIESLWHTSVTSMLMPMHFDNCFYIIQFASLF